MIAEETDRDRWYLLHTNQSPAQCPAAGVLNHYKSLLEVEEAFRELKTYLKVRPVYHYRADRVVNHIRLCFPAYWVSARLGREWALEGSHEEVVRVLRRLQSIRVGRAELCRHRRPYRDDEHPARSRGNPPDPETSEALFSAPRMGKSRRVVTRF